MNPSLTTLLLVLGTCPACGREAARPDAPVAAAPAPTTPSTVAPGSRAEPSAPPATDDARPSADDPVDPAPREPAPPERLEHAGIRPLTRVGPVLLAGQPTQEAFEELVAAGATVVVDLRRPVEQRGFDEPRLLEELGVEYVPLGFGGDTPLTDAIFDGVRERLRRHHDEGEGDLVLHCASSNRVGAVWLASRVLDEGVAWGTALEEARQAGLSLPALEAAARAYVDGGGNQELGSLAEKLRAELPDVATITVEALAARLAAGDAPLLIDARAADEYAVSHLPGAVHAPDVDSVLEHVGDERGREVVVYCSVGYRSGYLAMDLAAADLTNVLNLEGSIFAWANRGLPVVRNGVPVDEVHPYDEDWGRLLRRELHPDR